MNQIAEISPLQQPCASSGGRIGSPGPPGQAGRARPPLRRYACRLFAHKTGFSPALMNKALRAAGFANVYIATGNLEVGALAFLQPPDVATRQKLGLPASG